MISPSHPPITVINATFSLTICILTTTYDLHCVDLEFRQRQMEIDLRQLTISLKIGEDDKGEVRWVVFGADCLAIDTAFISLLHLFLWLSVSLSLVVDLERVMEWSYGSDQEIEVQGGQGYPRLAGNFSTGISSSSVGNSLAKEAS